MLNASEQTNIAKDQWEIMKQDLTDMGQGSVFFNQSAEDFDSSATTDENILYYLTGYVANKGLSFIKCSNCEIDLKSSVIPDDIAIGNLLLLLLSLPPSRSELQTPGTSTLIGWWYGNLSFD